MKGIRCFVSGRWALVNNVSGSFSSCSFALFFSLSLLSFSPCRYVTFFSAFHADVFLLFYFTGFPLPLFPSPFLEEFVCFRFIV